MVRGTANAASIAAMNRHTARSRREAREPSFFIQIAPFGRILG